MAITMTKLLCNFRSEVLELGTSMTVLLPDVPVPVDGYPTLFLLHGLSDDDSMWTRMTSLERYARERDLAVVMPQVHRSYYANEAHGGDYWTYLTDEVLGTARRLFRLSNRRADTFVAGLSMGGYGAFKWALHHPELFAAAASMSGAMGLAQRTTPESTGPLESRLWDKIFDHRSVAETDDDLMWLIRQAPSLAVAPPDLFVCCGTQDPLHEENVLFCKTAQEAGVDVTSIFDEGAHDWSYWDHHLRTVLNWLPDPRT